MSVYYKVVVRQFGRYSYVLCVQKVDLPLKIHWRSFDYMIINSHAFIIIIITNMHALADWTAELGTC